MKMIYIYVIRTQLFVSLPFGNYLYIAHAHFQTPPKVTMVCVLLVQS